jgi:hypothetical protein
MGTLRFPTRELSPRTVPASARENRRRRAGGQLAATLAHQNERMQALDGLTDRNSAFLSFLKGVLARGPVSIAELEPQARAAMLLGERQSITHSKPFKRAKKALGIRSVRNGFGAAGGWLWVLSRDPGYVAQSPGHLSTDPLDPEQVSVEPQPQRGGIDVPKTWRDKVASLRRRRPPADVPLHRWQLFLGDCEDFLDPTAIWAAKAVSFGWDALSLFGCAPAQPLAHMQVAGLIWALRGRKIVRLYPDWASIEDSADGSRSVFNRRVTYGVPIALPWSLR